MIIDLCVNSDIAESRKILSRRVAVEWVILVGLVMHGISHWLSCSSRSSQCGSVSLV